MLRKITDKITHETVVEVMLKDEDKWNHIEEYVTSVINQKESD